MMKVDKLFISFSHNDESEEGDNIEKTLNLM
jgi:hypothetical protein